MFDTIERLKSEWTDKCVVVHSPAPELARFARAIGLVKTVNMNGRCLVEFDQYNNTGWYDIDPSHLKVVPKPTERKGESPAKEAAKPSPASATKPIAKPAVKPVAAGVKRPSTADILAAARAKQAAAAPAVAHPTLEDPAEVSEAKPLAEPFVTTPDRVVSVETTPPKKTLGSLPKTMAEKIAWCRLNDAAS